MKVAWSGPERYSRSGGRAEGAGTVGIEAREVWIDKKSGANGSGRARRRFKAFLDRTGHTNELDALFEIQTSPFTHNFYIVEKERGLESEGIT